MQPKQAKSKEVTMTADDWKANPPMEIMAAEVYGKENTLYYCLPRIKGDVLCLTGYSRETNSFSSYRLPRPADYYNKEYIPETIYFRNVRCLRTLTLQERTNFSKFIMFENPGAFVQMGFDPEIFVTNGPGGPVIPAFEYLPPKNKAISDSCNTRRAGYAITTVFWDGFQAECTTTPDTCFSYCCDNLQLGLKLIYNQAKKYNSKARLTYADVVPVDIQKMPGLTSEQIALGCMPSLNAYGEEPLVIDGASLGIRTAGAHVHFQLPQTYTEEQYQSIVQGLDRTWGILSVAMFQGMEDGRRRQFYGRAGEYRRPSYGLEYRVPGPAMLCAPWIAHLSMDLMRMGLFMVTCGLNDMWEAPDPEDVQRIINEYDVRAAKEIVKVNEKFLVKWFGGVHRFTAFHAFTAFQAILHGINTLSFDPSAIENNWGFGPKPVAKYSYHTSADDLAFASFINTDKKVNRA